MKLNNTLSRSLEEFIPLDNNKVTIYQCGMTVYSYPHIGNMRAAYVGDIVFRTLNYLNYNPLFVRNYTDVGHLISDEDDGEDKMEKGAHKEGLTVWDIAQKYINSYDEDVRKLGNLVPTFSPRATDNIEQQISMVKTLLDKGYAYVTNDAVYFDISKAKNYNRLSHQQIDLNIKGAGHGDADQSQKRNPQDFALWIFRQGEYANHTMHWNTKDENGIPQFYSNGNLDGDGFPGWHIECSAMIKRYLGDTIDIHIGGIEHIPVHHTNEIAQSENANNKPFVNYWLHNEHLLIDGKKMSKSEGNVYLISDLEKKGFNALHLRYFFLNAHYRSSQNFTWEALTDAKTSYIKLKEKYTLLNNSLNLNQSKNQVDIDNEQLKLYRKKFQDFISLDFNTSGSLSVIWNILKDNNIQNNAKLFLLKEWNEVLGLHLEDMIEDKLLNLDEKTLNIINLLVRDREEARNNKDYIKADEIKKKILSLNVDIEDTKDGTVIKAISS